jgi:hypothetical protein
MVQVGKHSCGGTWPSQLQLDLRTQTWGTSEETVKHSLCFGTQVSKVYEHTNRARKLSREPWGEGLPPLTQSPLGRLCLAALWPQNDRGKHHGQSPSVHAHSGSKGGTFCWHFNSRTQAPCLQVTCGVHLRPQLTLGPGAASFWALAAPGATPHCPLKVFTKATCPHGSSVLRDV